MTEHFVAERILRSEYDDKYRAVIAAETVDDLATIFVGLPEPHPDLSPDPERGEQEPGDDRSRTGCGTQTLGMAIAWLGIPTAIGVWATIGQWWWFVIATVAAVFLIWSGRRIERSGNG